MGGGDEVSGLGPAAAEARSEGVQPQQAVGFDLGAPVPLAEVMGGIAPGFADEAGWRPEQLERQLADQQLRDELAASNFTGSRSGRFEEELARYGISVLRGWMYSGHIFQLAAGRGFALLPTEMELEELQRDSDVREELATMTFAVALSRFRKQALIAGGWRPAGGASLATYFMGMCLYVFPNEFRKRRVQRKKWQWQDDQDAAANAPAADHRCDPAKITVGNLGVRSDLDRLDPRTRAIVALTLDGYSQAETAEILGERSMRAVEGVLYRWRTSEQARIRGGR